MYDVNSRELQTIQCIHKYSIHNIVVNEQRCIVSRNTCAKLLVYRCVAHALHNIRWIEAILLIILCFGSLAFGRRETDFISFGNVYWHWYFGSSTTQFM